MPGQTSILRLRFLRESSRQNPPTVSTPGSAGLDLRADLDTPDLIIAPGERAAVPTGIAIEIAAPGVAGFVYSRSGLGAKHGLTVAQGVGVIDPDYRGEIVVWLLNTSKEPKTITRHERIAQLVLAPVVTPVITPVDELGETDRGCGGFGHTGKV
ncbi:deoxyuridine 5'-triphosphate nucleotidohydrolase Dut [Solidesulfovibrio carbinoliphilus subsp. oakridgensis]|uniref:dUTP diphosphatase n=1 Tax=Solidesulfovibrio carbinoliphilus subsp. oakridgensis TaxID=694327 RepID=G7Q544_9BACT|nr:dUTP diphosphatase [Solidesulfovibrio carbinoliphilus]EHJ48367.1 deoxyuridine 5'-triphosphate nucleotidohydrolase Dut [Solidesulfovibrio carbinoliphilus subsp. oakridgensis]